MQKEGQADEAFAEVYSDMDALLLSYLAEKALNEGVLADEKFKEYILKVVEETPFLKIGK